jgi:hypothetical protein
VTAPAAVFDSGTFDATTFDGVSVVLGTVGQVPPVEVLGALLGGVAQITRRCEVWVPDATQVLTGISKFYATDPTLVSTTGGVSVSYGRAERRMLDITLSNDDGSILHAPGQFYYDKIIKVFRGVNWPGGQWEVQIGEFMIDQIESQRFPRTIHVTGRDMSKMLSISKYAADTLYVLGSSLDTTVAGILTAAGVVKMILPTTGITLISDFLVSAQTDRATVLTTLLTSYGYEWFYNAAGYFVMRLFQDPATAPLLWTYNTGPQPFVMVGTVRVNTGQIGSLIDWRKVSADTDMINHWVVTGASTVAGPVYAEAVNDNVLSPTHRFGAGGIGDRVKFFNNPLLNTVTACQTVANNLLKISSLEDWEISMDAVVLPFLEVGTIIQFIDPDVTPAIFDAGTFDGIPNQTFDGANPLNPTPFAPVNFLLTDFDLPMSLGSSKPIAKRVALG